MALTRKGAKQSLRRPDALDTFLLEGTDKRGVKM